MNNEIFVQNVKRYSELRGEKPTVAMREIGAGKDMIRLIERAGTLPSVAKVQMLAQYLGCTVSDLLGETAAEENAKTAAPEGSDLSEEFARIISGLTPENPNVNIAEMLRRKREQ